ncbi:MAG: hypothetical protein ACQERI_00250 [Candidatus Krumholzibacteriota bacterium]
MTGKEWNKLVDPEDDLEEVAAMARDIAGREIYLTININNHNEGSAPLTIERLEAMPGIR